MVYIINTSTVSTKYEGCQVTECKYCFIATMATKYRIITWNSLGPLWHNSKGAKGAIGGLPSYMCITKHVRKGHYHH